jgi:hypothetical protein
VSDTETASWIAALERARAELEGALAADPRWRALRGAGAETSRAAHAQALAGNPVYRCWQQLSGAIEELRRQAQAGANAGAQAGPAPARRRIALRDILAHIRSDPALEDARPQAAASEPEPTEPARTAASIGGPASTPGPRGPATPAEGPADSVPMESEEATVSFVIREPARPAPVAGMSGEPSGPKEPSPPETAEPESDLGVEAEVVIVPRRR